MKSPQQQRQDERRKQKLDEISKQVEDGSLVIREMTDEERERYPVREPKPKRKR